MNTAARIYLDHKILCHEPVQSSRLHETMTVNRIVHDYPATRAALENLFVNVPIEGYHCLDEVAWRHGIESKELLRILEESIFEPDFSGLIYSLSSFSYHLLTIHGSEFFVTLHSSISFPLLSKFESSISSFMNSPSFPVSPKCSKADQYCK